MSGKLKLAAAPSEVKVQNLFSLLDSKKRSKKASDRDCCVALVSPALADWQEEKEKDKKSTKKTSHKTVELDEKLWSQTQISVASWADCDDDDDFGGPAPGARGLTAAFAVCCNARCAQGIPRR